MTLKNLFTLNAVVTLIFGLAFLLLPAQTFSLYGVTADAPMKFVGELFGSAFLAFSVISWWARTATAGKAREAVVLGMFVGDLLGFIVSIINQLGGVVNAMGWSSVIIYLVFCLGFGYFQFLKKA